MADGTYDWAGLSVGAEHACALARSPAPTTLWCWGENSDGRTGTDPAGGCGFGADAVQPQQVAMLE